MPISTVPSQAAIGYQLFELFAMSLSSQHKVSSSIVWDYAAPLRGLGHVGFRCLRRRRRWHHSALRRHDVDGAEQRHDSISARSVGRHARGSVFAVGVASTILHYDGTSWTAQPVAASMDIFGVWGTSGTNVFAVGGPR
jgi:hypothetical protein